MKMFAIMLFAITCMQTGNKKLEVVIETEKENVLLLGVENPLNVLIESTSKKDIVLTTNNGTIQRMGGNRFAAVPLTVGLMKINVCKIVKKDTLLIGIKEFRVHGLPDPTAMIGLRPGGKIKKKELISMGGVIAKLTCCGFDLPISILDFTLITMRDSTTMGIIKNSGPRYNEASLKLLNKLQPNDHLIVCGITTRMPQQEGRLIPPAEYIIEE